MAGQVPSVEPSSTRINSNVIPVASRTSVIARCSADVAGFVHRRNDHAQPRPVASLVADSQPRRVDVRFDQRHQRQSIMLFGDLSRGLLFQGNTFLTGHSLQLCGLCAPSGTHTKTVAVEGKVPAEAFEFVGEGIRASWAWSGSQRPVERSTQRLAGPTARRLVRVSLLALACGLLANCGGEPSLVPPADSSQQIVTSTSRCRNASGHPDGAADRRHCLGDRDRSSNQCADRSGP